MLDKSGPDDKEEGSSDDDVVVVVALLESTIIGGRGGTTPLEKEDKVMTGARGVGRVVVVVAVEDAIVVGCSCWREVVAGCCGATTSVIAADDVAVKLPALGGNAPSSKLKPISCDNGCSCAGTTGDDFPPTGTTDNNRVFNCYYYYYSSNSSGSCHHLVFFFQRRCTTTAADDC
jgi:hypothetical protein